MAINVRILLHSWCRKPQELDAALAAVVFGKQCLQTLFQMLFLGRHAALNMLFPYSTKKESKTQPEHITSCSDLRVDGGEREIARRKVRFRF